MLSTYRVLITLDGDYQLDLRGTEFGDLIGFEKKLITKTEYGTKLPNITNSIDVLNINTSAITDSIVLRRQQTISRRLNKLTVLILRLLKLTCSDNNS